MNYKLKINSTNVSVNFTICTSFSAFYNIIGNVVWNVIIDGNTTLSGAGINDGFPEPATIAYRLKGNIFILAISELSGDIKMVKIRVTGEESFEWLEAKYHTANTSECKTQESFQKDCYYGTTKSERIYNVSRLVAIKGTAMRQTGISNTYTHLLFQNTVLGIVMYFYYKLQGLQKQL